MWCNWSAMGFFGLTAMILFWAAVAALVIWGIRAAGAARTTQSADALAILERRFAAGEIDSEEFEQRRRVLAGR